MPSLWPWSPSEPQPSQPAQPTTPKERYEVITRKARELASQPELSKEELIHDFQALVTQLQTSASVAVHSIKPSSVVLGYAMAVGSALLYRRYFKRIPNAGWVTPDLYSKKRKRWIKGFVTRTTDSDNLRIYHTPGFGWQWPINYRTIPTALKDQTIHIRLAGIDAPEGAHFGRPAQKHFGDSFNWLQRKVEGKFVYCQLLGKDQYDRVVASVHIKPRFLPGFCFNGRNVSLDMLRDGWAEVYILANALYGTAGKDEHMRIQGQAQAARKGIWKDGLERESSANYKRKWALEDAKKAIQKN